MNKMCF